MDDLFGHVPQRGELFRPPAEPVRTRPIAQTPDTIRVRMLAILAEAQAAEAMPWTPRDLRSHTAMFPIMSGWLPPDEADGLVRAFDAELTRFGVPTRVTAENG